MTIPDLEYMLCERCLVGFVRIETRRAFACPYCQQACEKYSDREMFEVDLIAEAQNKGVDKPLKEEKDEG